MRSPFGSVRQLPSGRWQARHRVRGVYISAPATFPTQADARAWLDRVARPQLTIHKGCPTCVCRWDR